MQAGWRIICRSARWQSFGVTAIMYSLSVIDVGSSPTSKEGGILSQGDRTNHYQTWIRVRVFDSIGSYSDTFIQAQVLGPSAEALAAKALGEKSFQNLKKGLFYYLTHSPYTPSTPLTLSSSTPLTLSSSTPLTLSSSFHLWFLSMLASPLLLISLFYSAPAFSPLPL